MFGFSFLFLFAVFLVLAWLFKPGAGLVGTLLLCLCWPTWVVLGYDNPVSFADSLGIKVDLRVALSFVALPLVLLLHRKQIFPLRWHPLDVAMLALCVLHIVSDTLNQGFSLGILGRIYGEWCIPYLVGRVAISSITDIDRLVGISVVVCCILGCLAAVECLLGINLAELAFGDRPEDGANRNMERWGYKRSFGPNMHPIYFGVLQLLLLPWAFYASDRSLRLMNNNWYFAAPVAAVAGILGTLSRGPMLGIGLFVYLFTWVKNPKWMLPLVAVGMAGVVFLVTQSDELLNYLQQWSGEDDGRRKPTVQVDDETIKFTGTKSRLLIYRVYGPALSNAGFSGYGTERVTGFPISVPTGPYDAETLEQVRAIDNVYLLLALRFGYVAPLVFLALQILAAWAFIRLSYSQKHGKVFFAAMSAAVMTSIPLLMTVWMPHDYGFVLIMYFGIAAALHSRSQPSQPDRNGNPGASIRRTRRSGATARRVVRFSKTSNAN